MKINMRLLALLMVISAAGVATSQAGLFDFLGGGSKPKEEKTPEDKEAKKKEKEEKKAQKKQKKEEKKSKEGKEGKTPKDKTKPQDKNKPQDKSKPKEKNKPKDGKKTKPGSADLGYMIKISDAQTSDFKNALTFVVKHKEGDDIYVKITGADSTETSDLFQIKGDLAKGSTIEISKKDADQWAKAQVIGVGKPKKKDDKYKPGQNAAAPGQDGNQQATTPDTAAQAAAPDVQAQDSPAAEASAPEAEASTPSQSAQAPVVTPPAPNVPVQAPVAASTPSTPAQAPADSGSESSSVAAASSEQTSDNDLDAMFNSPEAAPQGGSSDVSESLGDVESSFDF